MANPRADDFWNSTFDEVLLVIKGCIERLRMERRNAWLIRCSLVDKPGDMLEVLPLPYDDEFDQEDEPDENAILFEQGKLIRMPGIKYADG
jgi:hypothetical protein